MTKVTIFCEIATTQRNSPLQMENTQITKSKSDPRKNRNSTSLPPLKSKSDPIVGSLMPDWFRA